MNIIVCFKYTHSLDKDSIFNFNPYDLYALHQIMEMKKKKNEIKIIALGMGPTQAIPMMKHTIALGCDEAYLVSDEAFRGADTLSTAYILSKAIEYLPFSKVICCGEKSIDSETGFVPAILAYKLNYLYIPNIKMIYTLDEETIKVSSEHNNREFILHSQLPIVIGFSGIQNESTAISLMRLKSANRYKVNILDNKCLKLRHDLIGIPGSKTQIIKLHKINKPQKEKLNLYNLDDGIDILMNFINSKDKNKNEFE